MIKANQLDAVMGVREILGSLAFIYRIRPKKQWFVCTAWTSIGEQRFVDWPKYPPFLLRTAQVSVDRKHNQVTLAAPD